MMIVVVVRPDMGARATRYGKGPRGCQCPEVRLDDELARAKGPVTYRFAITGPDRRDRTVTCRAFGARGREGFEEVVHARR